MVQVQNGGWRCSACNGDGLRLKRRFADLLYFKKIDETDGIRQARQNQTSACDKRLFDRDSGIADEPDAKLQHDNHQSLLD